MSEKKVIGFNYIKIADLIMSKNQSCEFTIYFDNKPAGKIKIKSLFLPSTALTY